MFHVNHLPMQNLENMTSSKSSTSTLPVIRPRLFAARCNSSAFSSIIDSNVTTFLTGVILYVLGQGPVRGFAVTLMIGIASVALAMLVGILVGALAALGGPILDAILMRLVDGMLTIPWSFLLITLTALFPPDTRILILLLGITAWPGISRTTRAELIGLKQRDFVHAARGQGLSETRILFRHMLPNAFTPLMVAATLRIGTLILFEASLSFLGFGVQPPQASWGNIISDGQGYLLSAWWVSTFPALALIITVVSIHLVGDGLRDVLDPRSEMARKTSIVPR